MPVFYLDENLHGTRFSSVLIEAGIDVRLCGTEGFTGVPDAIWIPEVAARGWVIATGDVRTKYVAWEERVIVVSKARKIHVKSGKNSTHAMLARNFVQSYERIVRYVMGRDPPYLATLTRPSKFEQFERGQPGRINDQDLSGFT